MDDFDTRCQQTFERIQQAAADDARHTLTLHMWEAANNTSNINEISPEAFALREREQGSLLSVMSGDPNATYYDKGFLYKNAANRHQSGTAHGAIGISTTPISSRASNAVFSFQSDTGLLMVDATPVYCGVSDSWSLYYDRPERVLGEGDIETLYKIAMDQNGIGLIGAGLSHLYDHPEDRAALAGKIALLGYPKTHPIALGQVEDIGKPYYLIDPLSPEQQQKARAAYTQVIDAYANATLDELKDWKYPEICVNASLANVAGITVMNFKYNPAIDPNRPWSETLADPAAGEFVKSLYRGLHEYDQLEQTMRAHNIGHTPTLVIHQPWVKEAPLVHCPPTDQLRHIVDHEMKSRGFMPPTVPNIE